MSYVLLWGLALALCVTQIAILRHLGTLFEVLDPVIRFSKNETQLRAGQSLPRIPLITPEGAGADLKRRKGSFLLVLVVQYPCVPCNNILDAVRNGLLDRHVEGWRPVLVTQGNSARAGELRRDYQLMAPLSVLADETRGAWRRWQVTTLPSALVINDKGRVERKLEAPTEHEIRSLLNSPPREHWASLPPGASNQSSASPEKLLAHPLGAKGD